MDTVQLAADQSDNKSFRKGTIQLSRLKLQKSVPVNGLNETVMSVGKVCDNDKIVAFTRKQAVILNISEFTENENDIISVAHCNIRSRMYEITQFTEMACKAKIPTDINLWNRTLLNTNVKTLKTLCEK